MEERYWMLRERKKGPVVTSAGYYRNKWKAKKIRNRLRKRGLVDCVVSAGPDNKDYMGGYEYD